MTTSKVKLFKGYEIESIARGNKTISCKISMPTKGESKEFDSISAAKLWINQRSNKKPSIWFQLRNWISLRFSMSPV